MYGQQQQQYPQQGNQQYPQQYGSGVPQANNGYQSVPYSNQQQNQQYPGQQYGSQTNYQQGQQNGGQTQYAGQQGQGTATGSGSGNSSEPGYLRDYHGDQYTDPQRIKDTQELNKQFFQGIGGEPQYQGTVDGPGAVPSPSAQGGSTQGGR